MSVKKVLKRISIFLLAAIVLTVSVFCYFNQPKQVKAEVVSATILGVSALLAFLAAQGVSLSFNGLSDDSISSEVNSMMSGYTKDGQTWADWNANTDWVDWLVGKENKTKFMCLSYEFLNWASDLPDWLKTTFGLQIGSTSSVFGRSGYVDDNGFFLPIYQINGGWISALPADGIFTLPLTSNQSFSFVKGNDSFGVSLSTTTNSVTAYSYINGVLQKTTGGYGSNLSNQNIFLCINQYYNKYLYFAQKYDATYSYIGNSVLDLNSFFSNSSLENIGIEGSLTDGYQDLQDALNQDLTDQVGNDDAVGVIDVGGLIGVTQEQLTDQLYEKVVAGDLDIDGVGVDVYTDTETVEREKDAEKAPSEVSLDNNIVIVDGLEDFFPFCIPFDFIALLEQFNAEPEAPKFTVEIGFGGVFEEEEIEIDLSPFETAAEIFRILMIIGFAVLLILKTRDLIRG